MHTVFSKRARMYVYMKRHRLIEIRNVIEDIWCIYIVSDLFADNIMDYIEQEWAKPWYLVLSDPGGELVRSTVFGPHHCLCFMIFRSYRGLYYFWDSSTTDPWVLYHIFFPDPWRWKTDYNSLLDVFLSVVYKCNSASVVPFHWLKPKHISLTGIISVSLLFMTFSNNLIQCSSSCMPLMFHILVDRLSVWIWGQSRLSPTLPVSDTHPIPSSFFQKSYPHRTPSDTLRDLLRGRNILRLFYSSFSLVQS